MKQTYLFIDGGHLQRYYTEAVREWFGGEGELDFRSVIDWLDAYKCFYYDCEDKLHRPDEMQYERDLRIEKQTEYFNKIREVPGCHVRLGYLVGSTERKKRQKGVDVLLTVDMMNHAIRKNMRHAILLTGDQDFKPLVESLVQMGIFVEVVGDARHTSQELIRAADSHRKLTFHDYFAYSVAELRSQYPIPDWSSIVYSESEQRKDNLVQSGVVGNSQIDIYQAWGSLYQAIRVHPDKKHADITNWRDLDRLKLFFKIMFGDIEWS